MSDLSNYAESKLYDWSTGRANAPATTGRYLALFTAITDSEAGTGVEVAVSGYARQLVAFGADVDGAGSNSGVIDVGPLQGAGTVVAAGLFDAAVGGNAITRIKNLAVSKDWAAGDTIRFAVGEIDFAMA